MVWLRAALVAVAAGTVAAALLSGGSAADPATPPGLPGLPPPFLGTAIVGDGGLTAAIDAYGDVVDLRTPGPVGRALIDNPAARQATGTVAADTGVVARVRVGGMAIPLWRADSVTQRYRRGTNVVVVSAAFGSTEVQLTYAARKGALVCLTRVTPRGDSGDSGEVSFRSTDPSVSSRLFCGGERAQRFIRAAEQSDRRWLSDARPLGPGAPAWALAMYRRSLLTLRALTDRRSGAVAAGARDGWAYVWPRDAGAAALAFAAAGYETEAHRVARFLLDLDLQAAARFHGDGSPVAGREAQGDAAGWAAVAARAAGLAAPSRALPWRNRADYQERDPGDYLANAIADSYVTGPAIADSHVDGPEIRLYGGKSAHRPATAPRMAPFETPAGLARAGADPASGLDSAAAWAVRPFPRPALFPAVRRTLLQLAAGRTRFGIVPSEDWDGVDPWTAPTAWTAWSLAALGERRAALRLLAALRRAATPAGALPERVDARTGIPTSTTPLAWSHAFAILALRELWS